MRKKLININIKKFMFQLNTPTNPSSPRCLVPGNKLNRSNFDLKTFLFVANISIKSFRIFDYLLFPLI
jgi:hypothetical protein